MARHAVLTSGERHRIQTLVVLGAATFTAILIRLASYDYGEESTFFHPHGYCYLWLPSLVAAHVVSDLLIGLSYVAISVTLVYLVWKTRRGLPFSWIFVAFGAFIVACGATHFMEVWTLWTPVFWLSADVKIITAIASVATAIALPPLVPKVLTLLDQARLSEQRRLEVEQARAELERRVEDRTRDLAGALVRAEDANRAKEAFLATVSHELRTPLNAVLGWTDVLEKRPDAALMARALPIIRRNAQAQERVVRDLVDLSSMTAGRLRIEPGPVDLREVIHNAMDVVRHAAENKGLTLGVMGDAPVTVNGDQARLQQVVWNLLSNAVKFTPEGGSVTVRLETAGQTARITVSDTGIGINPEFLPAAFERFTQADPSTTRTHQGMGLGLAIVRHLVELHGGRVDAHSRGPGQGATFIVELPLGAAKAVPARKGAAPRVNSDLRGRRVLVVDDEPDSRETVRVMLEAAGAETAEAASARAALARLLTEPFDALLSDIAMPEQDGIQLIREVRQLSDVSKRRIPAVALTAFAAEEHRRRALDAGFQRHVAKPTTADHLAGCINAAIEDAA
jgi:signal transduction histidine kinase/ActR/RegA family two-component response regulator